MNLHLVKFTRLPVSIENGILYHPMTHNLMSQQENYIMLKSAEVICQNGGNILNVGYGLGIIDSFIKTHSIDSHHIIELHPQLHQNALDAGFQNVHLGDWRDILPTLISQNLKFDGIYFDTYNIVGYVDEWIDFSLQVDSILNEGGIFSYINASDRLEVEDYLINTLNYTKHTNILPLQDLQDNSPISWDSSLFKTADYNLVYFIK